MAVEMLEPWVEIRGLLQSGASAETIDGYLEALEPSEWVRMFFRLTEDEQRALLKAVSADQAAELIEYLPDTHVADLIDDMPSHDVAAIVEEMASDERADLLA